MLILLFMMLASLFYLSMSIILRMLLKEKEEVNFRLSFIKNDLVEYQEQRERRNIGFQNFFQNMIAHFSVFFRKFTPKDVLENTKKMVDQSGRPFGLSAQDWIVIYFIMVFLMPFLTVFFCRNFANDRMIALLVFVEIFFGLGAPRFLLAKRKTQRFKRIQDDLPSALDLLSICVEAGSTLDGAMQKVVEKMTGPIAVEFDIFLHEVRLGSSRIDAYQSLAERVNLDDMKTFVRSMIQAEKTGSRIGNVLKFLSDDMRENKRMRLKAKIGKAIIKILIPIVLFIMPTTVIIVMGPVILKLLKMIFDF